MAPVSTCLIAAASRPAASRSSPDDVAISRRAAGRRHASFVERFARVDVADAGDHSLIEQGGLERRLSAPARAGERGGVEQLATTAPDRAGSVRVGCELTRRQEIHEAETTGIVERDDRARLHVEHRYGRGDRPDHRRRHQSPIRLAGQRGTTRTCPNA